MDKHGRKFLKIQGLCGFLSPSMDTHGLGAPRAGAQIVKFDDRIVVVDPASRLVVAMIPRYKLVP
jgi:hypothetical protein